MAELLHKELSFQVVGLAMKVHQALGPGFPEAVYHKAMLTELLAAEVPFETEKVVEVWYGQSLCGRFRLDLIVDNKIVLELKAIEALSDVHAAQARSYLKASGLRLAILLNFGTVSLQSRRVVH